MTLLAMIRNAGLTQQPESIMGTPQKTQAHPARALTVLEFAETYCLSVVHARRLIRRGDVSAVRLGAKVLIPTSSAEAWFSSLPAAASTRANARAFVEVTTEGGANGNP